MKQDTPNRLTLETAATRATVLVVNDANYPGWRAWVNGKATTVATANGMFRAVQVPRGAAKIEMIFEPQSVRAGLFFSLCGLFVLTAMTQVRPQSTVLRENDESDTHSTSR